MPSTPTDVHLSEVHLHIAGSTSGAEEVSSFAYSTADSQRGEEEQDEDGDQVVKRRRMVGRSGVLKLKHALLLCDYLLARPALVRDATVLELGSGCGLSGLLAAATARRVFLTDCVESVLVNAQENVKLNGVEAVTRVRALDWAEPVLPLSGAADEPAPAESSSAAAAGPFAWSDAERAELRECSLILAADCVYSNDMTDALVACLHALLTSLPRGAVALVAMELRINFCLASLAARAPAVDYFAQGLDVAGLEFVRVPTSSFAQGFADYERVKQLELWRVTVPCEEEGQEET